MMALNSQNINEKNEVLLHEGDGFMCAEALTKCKNSVCFIKCQTEQPKAGVKRGSGFYAKAKIFGKERCCIVTNHHVLSCEADAKAGCAIFGFEGDNPGQEVQLQPDKIFHTNKELDYTVVGVNEEQLRNIHPRVFPLEYIEQPEARKGDDVFIFQHPQGCPKQFSYEKILAIQPPYVFYSVDTDEGSSGSPVLRKLRLMAVHHRGNKEQSYNKGTLFSAIINDLHSGYSFASGERSINGISDSLEEMEENSLKRKCVKTSDETEQKLPKLVITDDMENATGPDDEILDKLSHECTTFYKSLGRQLRVDNAKIEEISKDHINYRSYPEKCFQVLQEWKESESCPCTFEQLEKALKSLNKNALAKKYCVKREVGFE